MKLPETIRSKLTVKKLKQVEPTVRSVTLELGQDHDGDPALFLRIILDDSVTDQQLLTPKLQPLRDWVYKAVWQGTDFQIYPYVRFVRAVEDKELALA